MLSEFSVDLCFIREERLQDSPSIKEAVEKELLRLFEPYARWSVDTKKDGSLEIAVAEMKGICPWQTEEELLHYMETAAGEAFWSWLQAYRLQVEPKEDAGSCKCSH